MTLSPGATILTRNAVHMRQSNVPPRIGRVRFLLTAPVADQRPEGSGKGVSAALAAREGH